MSYAHDIVRVTAFGSAFGGQEEWSTGFFLGSPVSDSADPSAEAAEIVANAWETFFENASTNISSAFKCEGVKLAKLEQNGKTNLDMVHTHYYGTAIVGGIGGALPAQVSLVATLQSDIPRGLASKGRMYLPGIAAAITPATGKLDPGYTAAVSLQLQTLFNTINGDFGVPGRVVNASFGRKNELGYGVGINAPITSIRVGDVYDTQRRRRNGFNETYASKSLSQF